MQNQCPGRSERPGHVVHRAPATAEMFWRAVCRMATGFLRRSRTRSLMACGSPKSRGTHVVKRIPSAKRLVVGIGSRSTYREKRR